MSFELKVLDREPGKFVFSSWGNISFFFWTAPASLASVERLRVATEPLYQEHARGVSNVHVVQANTGIPPADVREQLVALMRSRAQQRAALAVVPAGSGFWASTLRSFVTGMRLASPRSFDLGVYATLAQASEWLPERHREKTGVRVDPESLLRALQRTEALAYAHDREQTFHPR